MVGGTPAQRAGITGDRKSKRPQRRPDFIRLDRFFGGAEGDRTPDLVIANDALSQLSYCPAPGRYVTDGGAEVKRSGPALPRNFRVASDPRSTRPVEEFDDLRRGPCPRQPPGLAPPVPQDKKRNAADAKSLRN